MISSAPNWRRSPGRAACGSPACSPTMRSAAVNSSARDLLRCSNTPAHRRTPKRSSCGSATGSPGRKTRWTVSCSNASLLAAGKRVLYAATGQEADRSFSGGLISYVEHYQSGDYLRKLSRDTMRGLVSRAERGLWTGGPIPFGYDRLILDQSHARGSVAGAGEVAAEARPGAPAEPRGDARRWMNRDH